MKIQDNSNHDSQRSTEKSRTNEIPMNSSANPILPVELILEVLLLLPVLSLLRFRSVCKLWLSMISSPKFVKLHLSKSSENSHFADGRLISTSFILPDERPRDCSVYSLLNEPFYKPVVVDCPINDPYMLFCIVGSCNGLICLVSGDNKLFFWNPATRISKQLQNSDIDNIENYKGSEIVYGFGYSDLDDDYKVVAIYCFYVEESMTYKMKVKIYSSRLHSWRCIEDFPSTILLYTTPCQSGKLANGVLHWAATRDGFAHEIRPESLDSWSIVSLDLKTEQYGEVVQPKYGEGIDNLTLGVLERSLCVLGDYRRIRADVWIMKEYGVKKSWIKLASIPYVGKPRSYDEYSVPLCISTNGDIVLEGEDGIVVYNSKNCRFKDILITKFFVCWNGVIYIQSLVSPNV